jgi:hypothetical protein
MNEATVGHLITVFGVLGGAIVTGIFALLVQRDTKVRGRLLGRLG